MRRALSISQKFLHGGSNAAVKAHHRNVCGWRTDLNRVQESMILDLEAT